MVVSNCLKQNICFQLLSQGKTDDILSLHTPVLRRLERVTELPAAGEPPRAALRFCPAAPAAPAPAPAPAGSTSPASAPALVGRLYTAAPDPQLCVVATEGKIQYNRIFLRAEEHPFPLVRPRGQDIYSCI